MKNLEYLTENGIGLSHLSLGTKESQKILKMKFFMLIAKKMLTPGLFHIATKED